MIALYKGKSPVSRAIKWVTWGDYSHASWICEDESCIEAWMVGGVRHTRHWCMDHTPGTEIDFYNIHGLTNEQRAGIEEFLLRQVGKGYDFRGITRFLSRRAPNNGDIDSLLRWFCSVLIFAAVQKVRRPLLQRVMPHQVHPTLLSYAPALDLDQTRKTWKMENEYYTQIV